MPNDDIHQTHLGTRVDLPDVDATTVLAPADRPCGKLFLS